MDSSANKVAVMANPNASRPNHREFSGQVLIHKMDILLIPEMVVYLPRPTFSLMGMSHPECSIAFVTTNTFSMVATMTTKGII